MADEDKLTPTHSLKMAEREVSDMEQRSAEDNIEAAKIELERYKAKLSFIKFALGSVFAAIVIAAIPPSFQYANSLLEFAKSENQSKIDDRAKAADQQAKQEEFRQLYVKDFLSSGVSQNIELRIRLAEYFSHVSSETLREGWHQYSKMLVAKRNEVRARIDKQEAELKLLERTRDQEGIDRLRRNLDWSYDEVGYLAPNRSIAADQRPTDKTSEATGSTGLKNPNSCKELLTADFKGQALKATSKDFEDIAKKLDIEVAVLQSVVDVQGGTGGGFLKDGRPRILFERHIFHRLTAGRFSDSNPDISSPRPGGYGASGSSQYERLKRAMELDCGSALAATSWGLMGVLGSNYRAAEFTSIDQFVAAQMQSERNQIDTFAELLSDRLINALRQKDWPIFTSQYNGSMGDIYIDKLKSAYSDRISKK